MNINKIHIENFKCFKGMFKLPLNKGINILVGDNEAGKSTIIEAIHLGLTGLVNGKYLKQDLTQYIFNTEAVQEYVLALEQPGTIPIPPHILIEIYMEGEGLAEFEGLNNSLKEKAQGVSLKIAFDDKYSTEYAALVTAGGIKTLPIEYYSIYWTTFALEEITPRSIPIKSALIDSSSNKYQNGSDMYISRIVREMLEEEDIVNVSQAHRRMKESFMGDPSIKKINEKIQAAAKISDKRVELSVELVSKNAWEGSLMTYLEDIPFHYVGKGEQSMIKTKLALAHKKAKQANLILLEEPENHLSHTKLNQLITDLHANNQEKQVVISTHSSFVANKLGLSNLILLNDRKTITFNDLKEETWEFFERLAGYDTLRLILCKKAILVEGDSDELVVQKAYMKNNGGRLPIQDGVDVISVGTSFLRFLEIAEKLSQNVAVVTDNDGNIEALEKKYENYLGKNAKEKINICYDNVIDTGTLEIGDSKFNYNTLEPKLVKENGLSAMNSMLGTTYSEVNDLHRYMKKNKTESALKIFEYNQAIKFPKYIVDALS